MEKYAGISTLPMIAALFLSTITLVGAISKAEIQMFRDKGTPVHETAGYYLVNSTGFPDHEHGDFPNPDNPNTIEFQDHDFILYKTPSDTASPTCLPMGSIAVSLNGIPLFNPFTIAGEDANEVEVFDECQGHPDPNGAYHYHQTPMCIYEGGNDELVGSALDGYPVYGPKDENGNTLTSADLDDCHGRYKDGNYRYHLTEDFPYIMGCFRGDVSEEVKHRQRNSPCEIIPKENNAVTGLVIRPGIILLLAVMALFNQHLI